MENSKYVIGVRNFDGKEYVEFDSYKQLANESCHRLVELTEEIERLKTKNAELDKENTNIQESHMKLYNDSKEEIRALKEKIKRLRGECGENRSDAQDTEGEVDLEALVYELQDQHQQDCIRFNNMRTAYLVATDELSKLRKQFGVG